jgi:4-hydroxy-tetrahydrodipicolinate synthase
VAALTPVDRKGKFDEGLARDLLAYFQSHGVDGVLVLGTTGEFSSFSVAERKRILEVMLQHRGNLDVMCHVTTPNLPETLELLDHAARAGADKALVLPPYYYKNPTVEGLEAFFVPVLEKARIPVLLYHIPATSGVPITPELVRRLSRYEKLYGIKDSSGNQQGLLDFIREFTRLRILTGSPRLITIAIQNGGGGAITGNGNVIPAETAAIFRDHRAGKDLAAAQARLDAAARVFPGDIPKMKFALGELGLRETFCRPPFTELRNEEKAELKSRIASAGRS